MSKLSITVPSNLLTIINQRIESGDYASISDYIRDLIRRDASHAPVRPDAALEEHGGADSGIDVSPEPPATQQLL